MKVETLTAEERAWLRGNRDTKPEGHKALRIIDALEDRVRELEAKLEQWPLLADAAVEAYKTRVRELTEALAAAEDHRACLCKAVRVMRECRPWMPSSRSCPASRELDEFLRIHPAG